MGINIKYIPAKGLNKIPANNTEETPPEAPSEL